MALQGYQYSILEWIMIAFTLVLITILLRNRHTQKVSTITNLSTSFIIFAWISYLIQAILDTILVHYGWPNSYGDTPEDQTTAYKVVYVWGILYLNPMYSAKVAILAQYFVMIPQFMTKTRYMLRIISVIVVLAWLSELLGNILWCLPVNKQWSSNELYACNLSTRNMIWYIQTIPHLMTDLIVYTLPLPTIFRLSISRRQRVGLYIMFISGAFCLGFAVVNTLSYFVVSDSDSFRTLGLMAAFLEPAFAFITVCLPAFKHFLYSRHEENRQQSKEPLPSFIDKSGL